MQAASARRRLPAAPARAWPSAIAAVVLLGCLVWLTWQAGGYFPPDYLLVGTVVFATCGVILLACTPPYRLSTQALVGLGALGAYAAWTGLSATWSPSPDAALEAMQRDVVHAGLFGLALIAVGSGRYARHLVWGLFVAMSLVVGAALISRLYPGAIQENIALAGGAPYRVAYPWTYWNAAGTYAAMAAVLAFGLSADPRVRIAPRSIAAAAAVLLFVTMYLSLSRGAWLALVVGLLVIAVLSAHRGSLLLTFLVVGAAATLALLRLRSYPALTLDPDLGAGQASAGRSYAPQLILLAAGAGVAQAVVAAGRASEAVMTSLRRVAAPVATAVGVVVLVFGVVAYGLRAGDLEGWTADRLHGTGSWVEDQWSEFVTPTVFTGSGTTRLTTARGTRGDVFRVAFDAFEGSPLIGEGAGSFEQRWIREREVNEEVRNAHSLGLETLGELGIVGGLLLAAFLASLIAAALRSRGRPGGLSRSQVAAVAGAASVWMFHSFVDWDWQMTALSGTSIVLAAALYPEGKRRRRRPRAF